MEKKYRVVGIIEGGQGFKTEVIPMTFWNEDLEEIKKCKISLEEEQEHHFKHDNGAGAFIGYYKIEKAETKVVYEYI